MDDAVEGKKIFVQKCGIQAYDWPKSPWLVCLGGRQVCWFLLHRCQQEQIYYPGREYTLMEYLENSKSIYLKQKWSRIKKGERTYLIAYPKKATNE